MAKNREMKSLRRQLWLVTGIAAIALVAALWPSEPGERDWVLRDANGVARASVQIDAKNDVVWTLAAPDGEPRLSFVAGEQHGTAEFLDSSGHVLARISTTPDLAELWLVSADGAQSVRLAGGEDRASITVVDLAAELAAGLRAEGGRAEFGAADPEGAIRSPAPGESLHWTAPTPTDSPTLPPGR